MGGSISVLSGHIGMWKETQATAAHLAGGLGEKGSCWAGHGVWAILSPK